MHYHICLRSGKLNIKMYVIFQPNACDVESVLMQRCVLKHEVDFPANYTSCMIFLGHIDGDIMPLAFLFMFSIMIVKRPRLYIQSCRANLSNAPSQHMRTPTLLFFFIKMTITVC